MVAGVLSTTERLAKLPDDLLPVFAALEAEWGLDEALVRVERQGAWRRRGERDAKPCLRGCGTRVLWRWERGRKVAVVAAGVEHTCEPGPYEALDGSSR